MAKKLKDPPLGVEIPDAYDGIVGTGDHLLAESIDSIPLGMQSYACHSVLVSFVSAHKFGVALRFDLHGFKF